MTHHKLRHELIWKEVVVLSLIALFSMSFYGNAGNVSLITGFSLLSLVLYIMIVAEEKKIIKNKKIHDYFDHTSSYFVASLVFFIASYLLLIIFNTGFMAVTSAIGIICFSVGLMRLIFSKVK